MIASLFHVGGKVASQQQVVHTQTTADDQKVINQIIEAHKPDANFAVDEKPLLSMVLDILSHATPTPQVISKLPSIIPFSPSAVSFKYFVSGPCNGRIWFRNAPSLIYN